MIYIAVNKENEYGELFDIEYWKFTTFEEALEYLDANVDVNKDIYMLSTKPFEEVEMAKYRT